MSKKTVMIYYDPYTRKRPEGKAIIIKDLGIDNRGAHHYKVHFLGDSPHENVERIVIEEKSMQVTQEATQ